MLLAKESYEPMNQLSYITNFHLSSSIPSFGSPSPNTNEKTYNMNMEHCYLEIIDNNDRRQRNSINLTDSMEVVLTNRMGLPLPLLIALVEESFYPIK